jgi:DNA polymerase epsilon subunit 1
MIHDFIFALCTIIPTYPDEVLRRGSGTLCEDLLMAKAWGGNIIFPNKQQDKAEKYHQGKLIESETYIGGHVECLQNGIYRSDLPVKFKLMKEGYQDLLDRVEEIIDFALEKEMGGIKKEDVENYDEIKTQIE